MENATNKNRSNMRWIWNGNGILKLSNILIDKHIVATKKNIVNSIQKWKTKISIANIAKYESVTVYN